MIMEITQQMPRNTGVCNIQMGNNVLYLAILCAQWVYFLSSCLWILQNYWKVESFNCAERGNVNNEMALSSIDLIRDISIFLTMFCNKCVIYQYKLIHWSNVNKN